MLLAFASLSCEARTAASAPPAFFKEMERTLPVPVPAPPQPLPFAIGRGGGGRGEVSVSWWKLRRSPEGEWARLRDSGGAPPLRSGDPVVPRLPPSTKLFAGELISSSNANSAPPSTLRAGFASLSSSSSRSFGGGRCDGGLLEADVVLLLVASSARFSMAAFSAAVIPYSSEGFFSITGFGSFSLA